MRFAGLVALMVAMVLGIVLAARGEASWSARSLPVTSAAIESLVGDSQVTFSPPTGSPKVTADQAIAAAEGQLLDAKDQASSIVATLADVTDPIANADGLLAYDVRIEGLCVQNYGGMGGPACLGHTWHVLVDAGSGSVIDTYAVGTGQ